MDEVTRYTATARRSGGWWMVQCDQLPGALSQVRSLAKAADAHREAIAFVSGQAADGIEVDVHAELAPDLAAELEAAEKLAEAARDSLDAADRKRRDVARERLIQERRGTGVGDVLLPHEHPPQGLWPIVTAWLAARRWRKEYSAEDEEAR